MHFDFNSLGFGAVDWLFDALFIFVMTALVLALAQDKSWRWAHS